MMKWDNIGPSTLYILIITKEGQEQQTITFSSLHKLRDYVFRKELDKSGHKLEVCQNIHWPGDASLN